MTNGEIAVQINGHEHEIKSLKHRMMKQEEESKVLMELVMSVRELAANMERMITEQTSQNDRIEKLEKEPGNQWRNAQKILINTFFGAMGAALAAGVLCLMSLS